LQLRMYSSHYYLIFLLLFTSGLAFPLRNDQGLAQHESPYGQAFSLPIHRRRETSNVGRHGRRSRRDGASSSIGIGDTSDSYASRLPEHSRRFLIHTQIIYGSHQTWRHCDCCDLRCAVSHSQCLVSPNSRQYQIRDQVIFG
jgi:hypothetical protein